MLLELQVAGSPRALLYTRKERLVSVAVFSRIRLKFGLAACGTQRYTFLPPTSDMCLAIFSSTIILKELFLCYASLMEALSAENDKMRKGSLLEELKRVGVLFKGDEVLKASEHELERLLQDMKSKQQDNATTSQNLFVDFY